MIYYNAESSRSLSWSVPDAEGGETARAFLEGEKQLLHLSRANLHAAWVLKSFLEASVVQPLTVQRAHSGELLVRGGANTLLVTGQTARVLGSYLDDAPVRMQDRFDMTVRRRVNAG